MSYKNSCYVNGSYPLLLFLLMKAEGNLDDTFFFFGRGVPENIAKNFKNSWHLNIYFKKKNKFTKYIEMYLLYRNLEKFLIKEELINKEIYMQDDVSYSQFFLNHIDKCYLLENGLANYDLKVLEDIQKKANKYNKNIKCFRDKILKRSRNFYTAFGLSSKISKIYLTGLTQIPEIILNKVEIIDIKEKWKNLSKEKQEQILLLFNCKNLNTDILRDKILLITQPISEDKIVTEEEKIEIYREITKNYSEEQIVIKRHPREKTDYKNFFPNAYIIEEKFPLEILMLLKIPFKEVVTLFSTAALNFKGIINVNFWGTREYFKLKKEYGIIKKVYYKI